MAVADLGAQGLALQAALIAETGDLEIATRKILRGQGNLLKQKVQEQKKKGFVKGKSSKQSAGFFGSKSISVKDLPSDLSRGLGPAAFVRIGPPFLDIFQEGGTATPNGGQYLIVLTKDGAKLGFDRITKGNPWEKVYEANKKYFRIIKTSYGFAIVFRTKTSEEAVVYLFEKQVKEKKRLSIYEEAERIAQSAPEEILQELEK